MSRSSAGSLAKGKEAMVILAAPKGRRVMALVGMIQVGRTKGRPVLGADIAVDVW